MKNKKFYYISDQLFQTVKDSQVINWLELQHEHNNYFRLVLTTPIPYILKLNKLRKEKIKNAKSILNGKVTQIITLKANDKSGISDILIFIYFLIISFLHKIQKTKIIIQTRSLNVYRVLSWLKKVNRPTVIIFDNRGAAAEEFINSQGYSSIDNCSNKQIIAKYNQILRKQRIMCKNSSYVFCVSNQLKNYMLNYVLKDSSIKAQFITVPGAADNKHFFYNEELRAITRKELNLENKIVIIYSGKLDSHWHNKEQIYMLLSALVQKEKKVHFLCITPEVEMAFDLAKTYNISLDHITVTYVSYSNINKYLCAADYGIILRDNIMTNRVASPTKIPEYLLSGLPVLMSDNIGDYSEFVKKYNLGLILSNEIHFDVDQIIETLQNKNYNRQRISEIGEKYYSKQEHLAKILNIYKEL